MGTELDWRTPDSDVPNIEPPRRRGRGWIMLLVVILLLIGAAFVFYRLTGTEKAELSEVVERLIQIERRAISTGDAALYLSVQMDDPVWLATQFATIEQMAATADLQILDVEQRGSDVWVTVGWAEKGKQFQRLISYRWVDGSLLRGPFDPDDWGQFEEREEAWGMLNFYRFDRTWTEEISTVVAEQIATMCDQGCADGSTALTVTIAPDFDTATTPTHVRVPSPRLIGLGEMEKPSNAFWAMLRRRLAAQLQPASIRFAVPDASLDQAEWAAGAFSAQHPEFQIEIVPLSTLPQDEPELLASVDGALLMPTVAAITSGFIHDLSIFAQADAAFNTDDFYSSMLSGVRWQDRLWAVPQSAQIRLVYYDELFFRAASMSPQAYLAELWQQTAPVEGSPSTAPQTGGENWTLLDESGDGVRARAYATRCESQGRPCRQPLRDSDIATALAWYQTQVAVEGNIADVTGISQEERSFRALNWLSHPRAPLLWIDRPGFYEHYNQLSTVEAFALHEASAEIATPLHLTAGVISTASDDPLAVWTWLRFLSEVRPIGPARSIPVRRSVAEKIGYWSGLPAPLQAPMLDAFNNARIVTIDEEETFDWDSLAALINGRVDAETLAVEMSAEDWFSFVRE